LNSTREHTGLWLQIIALMFRTRQQFNRARRMIALLHQKSADAEAGGFVARPLMPDDVAEMKMAQEPPNTFYKAVKKNRID
jgi:hypothetical protein